MITRDTYSPGDLAAENGLDTPLLARRAHADTDSENELFYGETDTESGVTGPSSPRDQKAQDARGPSRLPRWLDVVWNGPKAPRPLQVSLVFPRLQTFPENLHRRLRPGTASALVVLLWASWLLVNVALARHSILATVCRAREPASGRCQQPVPLLNCDTNPEFWAGPSADCGLDAEACVAGRAGRRLSFKCLANCEVDGATYQHWPVGAEEVIRRPVVVGGGDAGVYRGDSFICAAALHAGVISRYTGGCGELEWVGPHAAFPATASKDGRFSSSGFDAEFPLNFRFLGPIRGAGGCRDLRGVHIAVNAAYILIAAYFLTSPRLFLPTLGVFGFWTVVLASNPPWQSGTTSRNAEFVSAAFQRFLPCMLGLVYIYHFAAKPQLQGMRASLSRMVFWGAGFLIGVLENFVFGALPIDRLLISDLNAQPGAWLALAIIVGIVAVIVVGQAYGFWLSGQFRPYFKAYILGLAAVVALGFWPGQTLRIHHYILALALLPGTCLQTTPSLFYQGLLVGLYVSGVARWDFDSLLQTSDQLGRGDAVGASPSDPTHLALAEDPSLIVEWESLPSEEFDGYSIVVNDIERSVVRADMDRTRHRFNLTGWIDSFYAGDAARRHGKWYVRVAAAALDSRPVKLGRFSEPLVFES